MDFVDRIFAGREQGRDVSVIDGVYTVESAADHLIQRLTEGWTLVRI